MASLKCKFFLVAALLLTPMEGLAAICSDCHTIHNSQNGMPMRFDSDPQPLPILLKANCISCHQGPNSAATIDRPKVNSDTAPIYVWGDTIGSLDTTLAGGSFWWVRTSDNYGHNIIEHTAAGPDPIMLNNPPGGSPLTAQLQCAGTNGCHGNPAVSNPLYALGGAHHTNYTGTNIDGTTTGKSYRFLNGMLGWEDDDWEFTSSRTDHNRYVGVDRTNETLPAVSTTVSGLCSRCHGYFHNTNTGAGDPGISYDNPVASPWLRHPTDFDITDLAGTEYAGYVTYDTRAPLARDQSIPLNNAYEFIVSQQGIITCLTCHRAHGSPYHSALRWNYRKWPGAGGEAGCQICHTSKN